MSDINVAEICHVRGGHCFLFRFDVDRSAELRPTLEEFAADESIPFDHESIEYFMQFAEQLAKQTKALPAIDIIKMLGEQSGSEDGDGE